MLNKKIKLKKAKPLRKVWVIKTTPKIKESKKRLDKQKKIGYYDLTEVTVIDQWGNY